MRLLRNLLRGSVVAVFCKHRHSHILPVLGRIPERRGMGLVGITVAADFLGVRWGRGEALSPFSYFPFQENEHRVTRKPRSFLR